MPTALARVTLPGAVGLHQAGHAEQAVGPERLGVEEVVVEPAVDHVDPLRAARRLEEDLVVVDEQVLAEDQLDAHVPGEEAVLEVGRVVRPRRQQHDARRVAGARRGDRAERLAQPLRDSPRRGGRGMCWKSCGKTFFITTRFSST